MIEFWNTKQHPITLFKEYPSSEKIKIFELKPFETGIALDKNDNYVAAYFYATDNKKIIGRFNCIEKARKAYQEYISIKTTAKGVYFSYCKGKFYVKHNGVNKNFTTEQEAINFLNEI
jgi:hypothetical protein